MFDYLKTQLWRNSKKILWDSRIVIEAESEWLFPTKVIEWVLDTPYFTAIDSIESLWKLEPTQCMLNKLSDCQSYVRSCEDDTTPQYDVEYADMPRDDNWVLLCNWYDYRRCFWSCSCPKEKLIDDHCFCYDSKMYHMSSFINLLSDINMKWEMFNVQIRWHDDIRFWWFFGWVYMTESPKEVSDCQKLNCKDCKKTKKTTKTSSCF